MLLHFGSVSGFGRLGDLAAGLALAGPDERQRGIADRQRQHLVARLPRRIEGGVGEDHDRRLEAFRSMHGHDADHVAAFGQLALDVAFAAIEPVDEALQRGMIVRLEAEGGIQQFVDGVTRFLAQPRGELAAAVERAGEDHFQIAVGRG